MSEGPIRATVRGGRDRFSWDAVKDDKHYHNYLGHSLRAARGRWQNNKDLEWFSRDARTTAADESRGDDDRSAERARRYEELRLVKEAEEDATLLAMGLPPKDRSVNVNQIPVNSPPNVHVPLLEKKTTTTTLHDGRDGGSRSGLRSRQEKRGSRKYELDEDEDEDDNHTARYRRHHRRTRRSRSRSHSRSRSISRSQSPSRSGSHSRSRSRSRPISTLKSRTKTHSRRGYEDVPRSARHQDRTHTYEQRSNDHTRYRDSARDGDRDQRTERDCGRGRGGNTRAEDGTKYRDGRRDKYARRYRSRSRSRSKSRSRERSSERSRDKGRQGDRSGQGHKQRSSAASRASRSPRHR